MTFKKINEGGAVSDTGVVVQIKHPDYLEYRDGENVTEVPIGYESATRSIYVYVSELDHWKMPDSTVPISGSQKRKIAGDLRDALGLLEGLFVLR